MGRHTLINLMTTSGRQNLDWSADYRLYAKERIEWDRIFDLVLQEVMTCNADQTLVTALDDSLLRKTGKKIPGVKYTRDPLGPPFQVQLVKAQRVVQMSAAVSDGNLARMIPIIFEDASTPQKPKKSATPSEVKAYREECLKRRLSAQGVRCITAMREKVIDKKDLWVTVDGSYTNRTVLRGLPEKTVLIGRIRSDAKLYHLPSPLKSSGRKRIYGSVAPTPAELLKDDAIPWQKMSAFSDGRIHEFKVKVLSPLRWRASGDQQILQVIAIAPLRYRLNKSSHLIYRDPAFLICTQPDLPPERILQAYLWRWDIETNFRDEKTLLGTGQAQVRNQKSVCSVPKMAVAAYSMMLMAGIKCWGLSGIPCSQNLPKWQKLTNKHRASTNDLIKQLRQELWADSIRSTNLSHFVSSENKGRSLIIPKMPPQDAILRINSA